MNNKRKAGFTLVELLASMTVLSILVVFIVNLTNNVTKTFHATNQEVEASVDGRAILDFLSREISTMVPLNSQAFPSFVISSSDPSTSYSDSCRLDEIRLIRNSKTEYRDLQGIRYYTRRNVNVISGVNVTNFTLMRGVISATSTEAEGRLNNLVSGVISLAGLGGNAFQNAQVAEGISTFFVEPFYPNASDRIPAYVDIYLGLLSGRDLMRIRNLSGDDLVRYVEQNERVFTTRVSINNYRSMTKGYDY